MRILITTGLSKADIGGPFQYATNLENEFRKMGHEIQVISYGSTERALPVWIRHLYFLMRIFWSVGWADKILTLDTYSVGVPTVFASKIWKKKVVARVGGDFLWSAYINRTSEPISLPAFYASMPNLNFKEKLIFFFMKNMIRYTDFLAFNTEWQRDIWNSFYKIRHGRHGIVRNFIPPKREGKAPEKKNFLWAGRVIPEKNIGMLKRAGECVSRKHPEFCLDIITGETHDKVIARIRECYAATSMAFSDICPNFIIEAISFNKPFIMTRETGMSEIFPKGGLFVDPVDEKDIEKAIEEMLEDYTYNKYVEELRSLDPVHSWREIADEFLGIWKK